MIKGEIDGARVGKTVDVDRGVVEGEAVTVACITGRGEKVPVGSILGSGVLLATGEAVASETADRQDVPNRSKNRTITRMPSLERIDIYPSGVNTTPTDKLFSI
jgi:hypothetical protein